MEGLDHGWKPSKYSLPFLAYFEERCFETDVSRRIVGRDPRRVLKHGAVHTIFSHQPQSSKPWTSCIERTAKSEREKVSKY